MSDNIHKDHRKRVKETFEKNGADNMHDVNLLEMMLFFAVPQGDTNPLAHRLLEKFGSFDRVLTASKSELLTVKGVGEYVATYLTMFLPVFKRYSLRKGSSTFYYEDTEALKGFLLAQYLDAVNEKAMIMHFDTQLKFLNYSWLDEGNAGSVEIDNKKVAASVIQNNSSNVILVHNHPSGISAPSRNDINTAANLSEFLSNIDVNLLDAAVVTSDDVRFFSRAVEKEKNERYNKK